MRARCQRLAIEAFMIALAADGAAGLFERPLAEHAIGLAAAARAAEKNLLQRAFDERLLWPRLRPPCPAH